MQVTKEPLDPCQVALTIEVEPDKVAHAADRAYREYAKYVTVPGFRKGKAPMNFVRQRVPESDVRQRAAEILIDPAFREALEQEQVTPFAQPRLEVVQLDLGEKPFIFKAVVPLAPEVELAQYTGLTAERKVYEVADEDIDTQIERMRQRAADYPQVERAAQTGDLLLADIAAVVDVRPEAADARPAMIEIGAEGNIPGFDEQVIGLSVGDTKTFTLTYPSDYAEEDLADQTGEFTVTVKEVREKQVPALDDELAKKLTNGRTETLDALKANLREELEKNLKNSAEQEVQATLVDQVVDSSTIKYPPVMVEHEVNQEAEALMQRLQQENVPLEQYLARIRRTREELVADMTAQAERRIAIGLALGEISEKENLAASDEDIDAAIAEQAAQAGTNPAAMRAYLQANNALDGVRNRAQTKKVLDFLVAQAVITDKNVKFGEEQAREEAELRGETVSEDAAAAPAEAPQAEAAGSDEAPAKKTTRKKTTKKQDAAEAQEGADTKASETE